ncbi:MAG TPA: signal peptidase II [Streptosporangiaceae bacterium]|nr:signal peptidase II [Streptosporangiaceae bacterium]
MGTGERDPQPRDPAPQGEAGGDASPATDNPATNSPVTNSPVTNSSGGRRRVGVLAGVAVFVLAADIITKVVVVAKLAGHSPIRLLGGLLTLRLLRNSGAAFSIGTSLTVVFTAIAVGVIIFILRTARRLRSLPWAITLGLLLGGATGNLADRLFRAPGPMRGYVVDWIQLPHWPVFNLADSAIVCGGVLAVLLAVRGLRLDGTRESDQPEPPDRADPADPADAAGPAARRRP